MTTTIIIINKSKNEEDMKLKFALALGQLNQLLSLGDGKLANVEHVVEPNNIIVIILLYLFIYY